ncbi:hypothetical protein NHH73_18645 [Oxalobacteraceae bacterium OTU3CINTB1]|nr:hypothetical protein NHH73_18645 [Oxalobacteraceae bacterium OTU3CINTB1]
MTRRLSYSRGQWRFAVNASNPGRKTYVASCNDDYFYGEPGRMIVTVRNK